MGDSEIVKIVYEASIEDDEPVEDWHGFVPAWVETLLTLGGSLRFERRPSSPLLSETPAHKSDYVSLKEAAAAADISERTLRRWIATKEIIPPGRFDFRGGGEQAPYLFDHRTITDLKLLGKSSATLAEELQVTERALQRRMTSLKRAFPNDSRLVRLQKAAKQIQESDQVGRDCDWAQTTGDS